MAATTKTSKATSYPAPMHPSRLFYFADGDTIISCRDRSYRVHSSLLARYSSVMKKALAMGRLPRLWKRLEDTGLQRSGKATKRTCSLAVGKRGAGGAKPVRDIFYFISLDDSVNTIELLFYYIYSCREKTQITPENLTKFLHLSISYSIPTLLSLCISFLKTLSLFQPLSAIATIRYLTHHRKTTPEVTKILKPLYLEALTTILNDLPQYKEGPHREQYTRIIPAEVQYAFSGCWASYVERVELLRSGKALFGGFTYTHSCKAGLNCEEETRMDLLDAWDELWETCTRGVPRPCEISRFFMTVDQRVGLGGKNGLCKAEITKVLGEILRDFGGDDAAWDWRFLAVEEKNLTVAKEAIERTKADL